MALASITYADASTQRIVAQEIALIRPDLRRVVLASLAPHGAAGMQGRARELLDGAQRGGPR